MVLHEVVQTIKFAATFDKSWFQRMLSRSVYPGLLVFCDLYVIAFNYDALKSTFVAVAVILSFVVLFLCLPYLRHENLDLVWILI
jgi:formate hydrogenlyase subunit 3/multisubunit Na+/H+ antiporter MnhD subunit